MVDFNGNGVSEGIEVILADVVVVAAVIAAVIAIFKAIRSFNSVINKLNTFFEDWYGEERRDGIDPRPGVLARLHNLEDSRQENTQMLTDIQESVKVIQEKIAHELNRNGGSSTKDAATEALRVAREIQQAQEADAVLQAKFRAQYLKDQEVTRREWESVFSTVQDMIGKDTEEQMRIWTEVSEAYTNKTLLGENDA